MWGVPETRGLGVLERRIHGDFVASELGGSRLTFLGFGSL